jgi:hypothetical protein
MISARVTPKVILFGLSLHFGLWLAVHLPADFGLTRRHWIAEGAIKTLSSCVAYALALALNLEIAAEYRHARWLRIAWLALAANAGISIIRIIFESTLINLLWPGYTKGHLIGLLQHLAIVPANTFLLLGLVAMWWAYTQVRLGFTIKRRDYLAIGGLLLLIGGLMIFREGLSESRSPYLLSRYLQLIGLVLLTVSAASSLVLHRMAMQMGGGQLAVALRFLTLYTLLRGVLVLILVLQRLDFIDLNRFQYLLNLLGWQAVPWIAALAAAYRVELTVHAAKKLEQQRAAKAALVSV